MRECSSCYDSHKKAYYKRLTAIPAGWSAYQTLTTDWFDANNRRGIDFNIFSTLADAENDRNAWTF
jgi:hypothetical protein